MTDPWYATSFGEIYYETYQEAFTPAETAAEVDGIIRFLNLAPGARLLDLCCGPGRHSLELARRGYDVTGLDLSTFLLDKAREAAAGAGLDIAWIEADMREIPRPTRPYDAVINLFSAFGYLESDAEEAKVIQAIERVLAPGGALLIDTANRELVLRQWTPWRWRENTHDGSLLAEQLYYDLLTGKLHVQEVVVHRDGRRTEERHSLRLWTFMEMANLLGAAGLTEIVPYGGFAGEPYTWDSQRMIVTARKPV